MTCKQNSPNIIRYVCYHFHKTAETSARDKEPNCCPHIDNCPTLTGQKYNISELKLHTHTHNYIQSLCS